MERPHMRDFVDDRTKNSSKSLLKLYTSGTPGKLQTCPSWTTDGTKAGARRALCGDFSGSSQVSIHLEAPRETTLGQEDVD